MVALSQPVPVHPLVPAQPASHKVLPEAEDLRVHGCAWVWAPYAAARGYAAAAAAVVSTAEELGLHRWQPAAAPVSSR